MKDNLNAQIEKLKFEGWSFEQIDNVLKSLTATSPGELKQNISDLFYLFSILPVKAENTSIDHPCFSTATKQHADFLNFLKLVSEGLNN